MKAFDAGTWGGSQHIYIFCPACAALGRDTGLHCMDVTKIHTFDGNYDSPTISPSLGWPAEPKDFHCHSYIKSGMIEYLSDCTHGMAGQTVELLDVPEGVYNRIDG